MRPFVRSLLVLPLLAACQSAPVDDVGEDRGRFTASEPAAEPSRPAQCRDRGPCASGWTWDAVNEECACER